jgi:glutamate-1-semialdehyde 2,1-aminomutase
MGELNEWSAARGSRFTMFGNGSSHMAYACMKAPGLKVRNHRDYWYRIDAEQTRLLSLELANRGFFPVHRGEISLSLPMSAEDIGSFIETTKEIVSELEG